MKLLMENWREYTNEMRDRYYAPGEAPEDPSPEEEEYHDYLNQKASEALDEAYANAEELVEVTSQCFISYDQGAEQYLVYNNYNPELGNYDDIFNVGDEDSLVDHLSDKIRADERDIYEAKKKPCKPSKGKRFAKRVDGKCRSYGQKGKAKDGGDRIRPGTKKGDAYCARSAKIKKCKNPPCANTLSRRKWKCRGSKSMKEGYKKLFLEISIDKQ